MFISIVLTLILTWVIKGSKKAGQGLQPCMNLVLGPIQDQVHIGLQTTKQELKKICFKFRDNGHCGFGLNCRYGHEREDQHYNQSNDRHNNRFGSTKPDVM